jgi:YHS domain-containing protein
MTQWRNVLLAGFLATGLSGIAEGGSCCGHGANNTDGPLDDPSFVCAVGDHLLGRTGVAHVYENYTYHFCCGGCLKRFTADPDRFRVAADPVSGETFDKAAAARIYAYQGRAWYFTAPDHADIFASQPERFVSPRSASEPEPLTIGEGCGQPSQRAAPQDCSTR